MMLTLVDLLWWFACLFGFLVMLDYGLFDFDVCLLFRFVVLV